jgi:hypothetical protein
MQISLPPAVEQQISDRARAEGLALDEYVERLLVEDEECHELFDRMLTESPASTGELFSRLRTKYSLARQTGGSS